MYPKYVTAQAEKNLINKLNLPNINSQDWEYEIADSFKLEGFLTAYKDLDLDIEERFALMIVIIGSYDIALRDGTADTDIWNNICRYLIQDIDIHLNTIIHWSLKDQEEDISELEGGFAVTHQMLEVYEYCKKNGLL